MHQRRLNAYENVLPGIEIKLPSSSRSGEKEEEGAFIDPASFFNFPPKQIWLEIGFGNGEHLLHQAIKNPENGMIGCEPFINGTAALCADIKDKNVNNIRIWPEDARLLLPMLADNSIDRCFLLNADPWPKKKHAKRRFIQEETLDGIHRLLKPGAQFRISTDHPALAVWELEKTYFHGGFEWQANCASDWQQRPDDLPETRYQEKGLKQGRPTIFLDFSRK